MSNLPKRAEVDLIDALSHARRYARVLAGDVVEGDALVAAALARKPAMGGDIGRVVRRLCGLIHRLHHRDAMRLGAARSRSSASSPEGGDDAGGLLEVFGKLDAEQREVLLLAAVETMSYEQIAEILEVPPSTVVARLKRAREALRAQQVRSTSTSPGK